MYDSESTRKLILKIFKIRLEMRLNCQRNTKRGGNFFSSIKVSFGQFLLLLMVHKNKIGPQKHIVVLYENTILCLCITS